MRIEVLEIFLHQAGGGSRISGKGRALRRVPVQLRIEIVYQDRREAGQLPELSPSILVRVGIGVTRGGFVNDIRVVGRVFAGEQDGLLRAARANGGQQGRRSVRREE